MSQSSKKSQVLPCGVLLLLLSTRWLVSVYSQVLGAALLCSAHFLSTLHFPDKQIFVLLAQLVLSLFAWRATGVISLYPLVSGVTGMWWRHLCTTATATLFAAQLIRGMINHSGPLALPPPSALLRRACARDHFVLYWGIQFAVLASRNNQPTWGVSLLSALSEMCASPVRLLATSVTVATLSQALLDATRKLLRVGGGGGGGGVTEGVTLAVLSLQTGLLGEDKGGNLPLLILILFVVLSSLMHSLLEVAEPVALGGGRLALFLCVLLLFAPIYLSVLLCSLFPLSLWIGVVVAHCSLTSVQALDVLVEHLLVWREWDDGVYYARAVAGMAQFAVALFLVAMCANEAIKRRGTVANGLILITHCYFNVWLRVVGGWRSVSARRAAAARILTLPPPTDAQLQKDDCCAICFEGWSGDTCATPCSHLFHRTCLKRWLNVQTTCPLCHDSLAAS